MKDERMIRRIFGISFFVNLMFKKLIMPVPRCTAISV
jgi:hypothetical protein